MKTEFEPPAENLRRGLLTVDIPELGVKQQGKVRDIYFIHDNLAFITTDRQSAFNHDIGLTPGKGAVLNLMSAWWMQKAADIIPHHIVDVPHPNVVIARPSVKRPTIEMIVRGYAAVSNSPTSLWHNVNVLGNRDVYGIHFDEPLKPYEKLPMGRVITPTTKGKDDLMLTPNQARAIVEQDLGRGRYEEMAEAALELFDLGSRLSEAAGLILADTKYEFGVDKEGKLMVIDEMHTPDSSRFWELESYEICLARKKAPVNYDKEILRKWLAENGFVGKEGTPVPVVPEFIWDQMSDAYIRPYTMLTGDHLENVSNNTEQIAKDIRQILLNKRISTMP